MGDLVKPVAAPVAARASRRGDDRAGNSPSPPLAAARERIVEWETTRIARRIGRVRPAGPAGLLVRYEARAWLLLEQDDAIMDAEAKQAFVAFGRALRLLVSAYGRSA